MAQNFIEMFVTNAYAGGGGDFQAQKMQVQKAYHAVKPVSVKTEPCEDLFEGIEVDALDKLYIQTRTFMDSWIIWVLILIGVLTVLPFFLGKFGVRIQSPFRKNNGK